MDLEEIKQLIEKEGGKIIIVENNKPVLIVLPYEEYKKRSGSVSPPTLKKREEPMVRPLAQQQKSSEPRSGTPGAQTSSPEQDSGKELTIDDLPL